MSVVVFYLHKSLNLKFVSLLISSLFGFLFYIFITFLLKLDEAMFIKDMYTNLKKIDKKI